jgi:hypothetical protein
MALAIFLFNWSSDSPFAISCSTVSDRVKVGTEAWGWRGRAESEAYLQPGETFASIRLEFCMTPLTGRG